MNENKSKRSGDISLPFLIGFALCSEIAYIGIASLENIGQAIPLFFLFYGIAFLLYWLSVRSFVLNGKTATKAWDWQLQRAQRLRWLHDFIFRNKSKKNVSSKEILIVGIVFSVIFRITLLFTTPSLSDDIYRYIWDGKVAASGTNPFLYAPEGLPLGNLRDQEIYPKINHKEIPTVYPPVSQMTFRGFFMLSPTVLGFKIGFLFLDLLTAVGLYLILRLLAMDIRRLLIYLWNPLLIVEISGSGHADILGILFMTFALYYLVQRNFFASTSMLVLAFLTKFIALFLLPVQTFLKKENKLVVPLLFIILSALLYLPYAEAGDKLVAGLLVYTEKWQFNSSVFPLLVSGVKQVLPEEWVVKWFIEPQGISPTAEAIITHGTDLAILISKAIVALVFVGVLIKLLWRMFHETNQECNADRLFKAGLILFGTFIVLTPTVHPWYLCWLLPFLVIKPNRAWLLLTGLCVLSYWVLVKYTASGIWQESLLVKLLEYTPFYILLIYDYFKKRSSAVRSGSPR